MIYCIEDDDNIRELMLYTLKTMGFEVTGVASGEEFWSELDSELPSLIVLDIMLQFCVAVKKVRKKRKSAMDN